MIESPGEGPVNGRSTFWLALIKVANVVSLLSLLPWIAVAFIVLLLLPNQPSADTLRLVVLSYPVAVVAARVASAIALGRSVQLAALMSLLPAFYCFGVWVYSKVETGRQVTANRRDMTEGEVYACLEKRVVKVRADASVWQLEGLANHQETLVGYVTADRKAFRYGSVETDLTACRSAAGRAFLDAYPPVSHLFACADGSRLMLEAYGDGDFVQLVDKRLPDKVFFARVSRGTQVAFVYDANFPGGPHTNDAARRAHTLTCRNEQGRTLLDLYEQGPSEHIDKR